MPQPRAIGEFRQAIDEAAGMARCVRLVADEDGDEIIVSGGVLGGVTQDSKSAAG